jgi:hypothetical protein
VPAKFYEYLQTGKPIFAVTERGATIGRDRSHGAGLWVNQDRRGSQRRFFASWSFLPTFRRKSDSNGKAVTTTVPRSPRASRQRGSCGRPMSLRCRLSKT